MECLKYLGKNLKIKMRSRSEKCFICTLVRAGRYTTRGYPKDVIHIFSPETPSHPSQWRAGREGRVPDRCSNQFEIVK